MKILIVEDDEITDSYIARGLREEGQSTPARFQAMGRDTIRAVQSRPPEQKAASMTSQTPAWEAARIFGIHRRTVEKMLRFSIPPSYPLYKAIRRPNLDEFTS
jgi:hypothetical protein